jgi:Transposase
MTRVPKTQRWYMSAYLKGQIRALLDEELDQAEIASKLGVPPRTVYSFAELLARSGNPDNQLHLGGPRKSTTDKDHNLIAVARTNTHIRHAALKQQADSCMSLHTIRHRLKEHGIQNWRAVNCVKLNQRLATPRLEWAKQHANDTVEDLRKVCWSDEVSIQKGIDPNQVWVF